MALSPEDIAGAAVPLAILADVKGVAGNVLAIAQQAKVSTSVYLDLVSRLEAIDPAWSQVMEARLASAIDEAAAAVAYTPAEKVLIGRIVERLLR